jgi:serine/threonine protein kinase
MSICKISEKYSHEEISTPLVKNILSNRFTNGPDMKAVLCLFDTLITASNDKEQGLYQLSTTVRRWVKTMKKIDVKSSEGFVYISDILSKNIKVVIKIPKNATQYTDLLREYYLGVTEINKLRYTLPNFVYTLGAFLYPHKSTKGAFVVFERIPGENLESLIKSDKITFQQFLDIFIQILLALEVAQRNCSFTHFDLHVNNVILRPVEQYKYTVVLDAERYDVTSKKFIPVILDFGMSSIRTKKRTVGSYYFPHYGMMNYMVQGADMYKFLFYSYIHAKGLLQRQIGTLFMFYGRDDPYNVLVTPTKKIAGVTKEFAKNITFSKAATYTPLEFLNWIVETSEFNSECISVKERNIYYPIKYSSTVQTYTDIFQEDGKSRALKLAESCSETPSSYIMLKYIRSVLKNYVSGVKIDGINEKLRGNRHSLVHQDKKMLRGYRDITVPDEFLVRDCISRILSVNIIRKKSVKKLIEKFTRETKFVTHLAPYLQVLYTIREMKLEKTYRRFLNDFLSSPQYRMYKTLYFSIEKARRWSFTLIESAS